MNIRTNCRLVFLSILGTIVLFLAAANQAKAQASCTGVSNDTQGAVTWVPSWCEEFNATTAGPPDTTVWAFDLGNSGFGNNELETYCGPPGYAGNPSTCPTTFSTTTSNAYLDGSGHLLIQAINSGGTWFSGRMKTQSSGQANFQNFQYGRIEASIQLPDTANQGLWPAFWSLGSDINTTPWPACGEVDFLEDWSPQVDSGAGINGNRTTLHTSATGGDGLQPNGAFTFPSGETTLTYHTYGTIWSANMMQFYIDNPLQPYYIATTSNLASGDTWAFNAQLFLIANIAVGGTLGGTPSNLTPNPGIMSFDHIRQYQPKAAVPTPALGTPPTITVTAGATTGNSSTFTPALTANTGYVYFSCSTNAPKASCSITTNDPLNTYVVSSSAATAETVTVIVATTANTAAATAVPISFFSLPPSFSSKTPAGLLIACTGFLLFTCMTSGRRARAYLYSCSLALGFILMGAASCGGGSSNNNTQVTPPSDGTAPGNYTVTVYAFTESNSGTGANSTADANVAIPLTVN